METFINQLLPVSIIVITMLAFIVQVITELIKDIGFFKKVPTILVVVIISIVITILSYFVFCSHLGYKIYGYGVVGAFLGSFIVAYVASYGWEKLNILFGRLRKKKK